MNLPPHAFFQVHPYGLLRYRPRWRPLPKFCGQVVKVMWSSSPVIRSFAEPPKSGPFFKS